MTDVEKIDDLDTAKQVLVLLAKENERLHRRLQTLARDIARLEGRGEGEQMALELTRLKEQVRSLQKHRFGDSSERRPSPKEKKERGKQKGHGPRPQPNLPVIEVLEVLDEGEQSCPKCQGTLKPMHGQTEDCEVIVRVEREYKLVEEKRQKYRCACNESIVTAPSQMTKVTKGGRYDLTFAIGVVVDKYLDHLPLERQVRIMERQGLAIDSQTLWDVVNAVAMHLVPSYLALRDYILSADVVGADETWWRLMGTNSSKRWWVWALTTHDACWYQIAPSRSAQIAQEVLAGYEGTVLCDGYKAYETVEKEAPNVRLAHCWAHARRHFVEAEPNYPEACGEALRMIGELFEIERRFDDPNALEGDAKQDAIRKRAAARDKESRPIIDKLRAWALEQHGLPKSPLCQGSCRLDRARVSGPR